jgi:hypothetical protein
MYFYKENNSIFFLKKYNSVLCIYNLKLIHFNIKNIYYDQTINKIIKSDW